MNRDITPIIFGWDLADYAMARLIHESSGIKPRLYSQIHRGFIDNSRILAQHITEPRAISDFTKFRALLDSLAAELPGARVVPLVNTDEHVQFLASIRPELPASWIIPYASPEAIATADSKARLSELAASLDLATPRQVSVSTSEPDAAATALTALTFPIVLKPEERSHLIEFSPRGLTKVLPCDTLDDAVSRIRTWHDAGIATFLTAQELIPGDDTTQWVVNGYIDRAGRVTAVGSGRVLVGNHEPYLLGNAGILHVTPNKPLMEDGSRLALAAGLRGFFSLDVKIDPRTATPYWLDLNPRIGRNHYYLKAGRVDVWRAFMEDHDDDAAPHVQRMQGEALYHVLPLRMLKEYLSPELYAQVKPLKRTAIDPLNTPGDRHPRRTLFRIINAENMRRKTRAHYPEPTDTGF
ncbi:MULTISPECIES: hypothetical protein [Trueperella]|uniref:carboxylate--amine ligase n=1 Tax=Trueperella TaxID=1069494 RepID=UPI0008A1E47D|nr:MULTISPECIES: hypothetical protein [Trueperella]OFS67343.1 hypothetical protein HMPREF3174_04015 [Trueperella sp. HMSC08H06]